MLHQLTKEQLDRYNSVKAFVAEHISGHADDWDREEQLPDSLLNHLGQCGYLGAIVSPEYAGAGWDTLSFGLLSEALGRGSSSAAVVVTVQAMVSSALLKWGTQEQKAKWLPPLAKGTLISSFALTEPGTGSATDSIATAFTRVPDSDQLLLNGTKRWISCAQMAGLFLVFGKLEGQSLACLVPREAEGLSIAPITDMMGFRAAGLAELHFENIRVPAANLVGKPGFGLSHVATSGLQYGRISTSCSALGLLRGCFEESTAYAATRKVHEQRIGELGMIRSLIACMGTDLEAARLLCYQACHAVDERSPDAMEKTLMAKYFASRAAVKAASDAVQIRGASGCHASSSVARYYRDSKIMEIIEGTSQIHEQLLGKMFVDQPNRAAKKAV